MARRPTKYVYRPMGRPIAAALAPVLAKPAAKHGFREARLLAEWSTIVGEPLAGRTRPLRLERRGGMPTLRLVVASGWALEVQHLTPQIADRINRYFGHTLVERLVLRQGTIPEPKAPRQGARLSPRPPLSSEAQARLDAACATVEDKELAEILRRLGEAVAR
ncbi:MAG: DUF721 domain-containing protein [Alphaproteobacteria bacterium]|nr:DUF721 domain-containing protein [Alphaproteobacteria bacterium]MCB9929911.1 DUF721 domain-containing protein [Alphaproteobacteria bacterium]